MNRRVTRASHPETRKNKATKMTPPVPYRWPNTVTVRLTKLWSKRVPNNDRMMRGRNITTSEPTFRVYPPLSPPPPSLDDCELLLICPGFESLNGQTLAGIANVPLPTSPNFGTTVACGVLRMLHRCRHLFCGLGRCFDRGQLQALAQAEPTTRQTTWPPSYCVIDNCHKHRMSGL